MYFLLEFVHLLLWFVHIVSMLMRVCSVIFVCLFVCILLLLRFCLSLFCAVVCVHNNLLLAIVLLSVTIVFACLLSLYTLHCMAAASMHAGQTKEHRGGVLQFKYGALCYRVNIDQRIFMKYFAKNYYNTNNCNLCVCT